MSLKSQMSVAGIKGAVTVMTVPLPGQDSIESTPLMSRTRSCRLESPSPGLAFASANAKPSFWKDQRQSGLPLSLAAWRGWQLCRAGFAIGHGAGHNTAKGGPLE